MNAEKLERMEAGVPSHAGLHPLLKSELMRSPQRSSEGRSLRASELESRQSKQVEGKRIDKESPRLGIGIKAKLRCSPIAPST